MVDPTTQTIPPNSFRTFRSFQLPPNTFAYEVRIIHPNDRDVVTNVFGLSASPFDPEEGNNVLQHDLARLRLR
jgi:hypothetical protein